MLNLKNCFKNLPQNLKISLRNLLCNKSNFLTNKYMPKQDGNGPVGMGPGTGWGRGPCGAAKAAEENLIKDLAFADSGPNQKKKNLCRKKKKC